MLNKIHPFSSTYEEIALGVTLDHSHFHIMGAEKVKRLVASPEKITVWLENGFRAVVIPSADVRGLPPFENNRQIQAYFESAYLVISFTQSGPVASAYQRLDGGCKKNVARSA